MTRSVPAAALLMLALAAGCPAPAPPQLTFGVTVDEHLLSFPIGEPGTHALGRAAEDGPITCASCHEAPTTFQEFSCVGCHEHEAERTDAIHRGLTDYRYQSARCLQCHPGGIADIGGIDDATHTADYFPIDDPSAHAAITCSSCHTTAGDRTSVSCTSCHEHEAAAMTTVHGQMDGYAWDSSACLSCHTRAKNPGAFEHPFFPTARADTHEGVTCKECHESPQDRTRLACTTCHEHEQPAMDAAHDAVPDYLYDSGSCVLCHRAAQVPGVIAHTFFPIDAPATHALGTLVDNAGFSPNEAITCASCHQNPETRASVTCTSCHAHAPDVLAPTHAGIPDYVWTDSACLFCHPNGEPTGTFDHIKFPIVAGTLHEAVSCNSCHLSSSNRAQLACTSCHEHSVTLMEPVHRSLPGYAYDPAACYTCHQSAQVPGVFDHEPLFPLTPPQHAGLLCTDCHSDRTNRAQLSCTSCHLGSHDQAPMATAHVGIPDYSWTPASCVGCHPNGVAAGAVFAHPFFPIAAGQTHAGYACLDCHTTPGDNTQVSCVACHLGTHDQAPMTTRHAAVPGFSWSTSQCLFCHPNSEPTGNIDHEIYFPLASPAKHAAIACVDCHIDANNRQVLGCAQCHAGDALPVATTHQGIPDFANTSPACLTCHPRAEPTGTMDHASIFPIASGTAHSGVGCTACHASRTDRGQNLCSQCHAGVPPALATSHARVRDFANNSVSCKECHDSAQVDRLSAHGAIDPRHQGSRCDECHRFARTDTKPWGIDFTRADCVQCHSASCTPNNRGPCN